MLNYKPYIHAIRLRTLPLALSSTILGSFIAAAENMFNWMVLVFASITTLLLQILSNLANDYGDFVKGTDNKNRVGPLRMVSSGAISPAHMIRFIGIITFLTLVSGSILIFSGVPSNSTIIIMLLYLLGSSAIIAAIKYTVGTKPYGYIGLGDIAVFIFFGLVGVIGTFYLHTGFIRYSLLLPAVSIGLLSAGVLNLNNLRDIQSDMNSGKRTLAVIMGSRYAKLYHLMLISGAFLSTLIYSLYNFRSVYQFLFMLSIPLFIKDVKTVLENTRPVDLNSELKKLALSTLLFAFCIGVGQVISMR